MNKKLILLAIFAWAAKMPMAKAASLQGIQESLVDSAMHTDITRVLLIVAMLILVAVLAGLWRYYRESTKKFTPLSWIDSPKQIHHILAGAVRHRSTFELQLPHRAAQRRPILRCSPDDFSTAGLVLEAQGIKNVARNWTERLVNCYFKINIQGQYVYYSFSTRIKQVEIKTRGRCALTLYLPERMENRQKRSFLRINLPLEYMLGAAIWAGKNMPKLEDLPQMQKWPKPALAMLPNKKEQFSISDISAGGARLLIPRKEMLKIGLEMGVAEQVILIIDLLNPDDRSRMRFWLHCRVQNYAAQYDTRNIEAGLQFLAWASPHTDQSQLEWIKLGRSLEVDSLGNWIIRRHLELFRDTPEADSEYDL